jgi:hypothetical protein
VPGIWRKATTPDLKSHYEQMGEVWDKLAEERLTFFVEPETGDDQLAEPIR